MNDSGEKQNFVALMSEVLLAKVYQITNVEMLVNLMMKLYESPYVSGLIVCIAYCALFLGILFAYTIEWSVDAFELCKPILFIITTILCCIFW